MSNFLTKEDAIQIMQGISKKTPQGIMIGNTTVGHITWQMYLMRDYLKLDGTPLANASNDYSDLLKFAQDNNLITADTSDKSLFKYDSTNNVLTLPDFIGLVVQGGDTVEEKEAGLPNIDGAGINVYSYGAYPHSWDNGAFYGNNSQYVFNDIANLPDGNLNRVSGLNFDASKSNPIYGNSTTVQPPAITLIPQIKYKKATVYEGIELGENYSTEEKRIGIWIDGKPLYQKTYIGTVGATNTNVDLVTDSAITTMENAFIKDGYFRSSTMSGDVNDSYANNEQTRVWINFSDGSIRANIGSYYASCPFAITLNYTKTTD